MKIQRALLVAAGLTVMQAANAGLSFEQLVSHGAVPRTESFNGIAGLDTMGVGSMVSLGKLLSDQAGTVSFTYLGQESGFRDSFRLYLEGPDQFLLETDAIGKTVSAEVGPGALNFRFQGDSGKYAYNSGSWSHGTSIAWLTGVTGAKAGDYQYILGYNDSAGATRLGDWDDFVVGVNFAPISPAPEPESYAMMLLGLGVVGAWVRRRKGANGQAPASAAPA